MALKQGWYRHYRGTVVHVTGERELKTPAGFLITLVDFVEEGTTKPKARYLDNFTDQVKLKDGTVVNRFEWQDETRADSTP